MKLVKIPTDFSQRFRELLEASPMDQAEAANMLRIDKGHVTRLLQGSRRPSPALVRSIAMGFGCREEWLATGEEPRYATSGLLPEIREHADFLIAFARLPTRLQVAIKQLVLMLADAEIE